MNYYDTTGELLSESRIRRISEDVRRVEWIFRRWPHGEFDALRVMKGYKHHFGTTIDQSSCRRAITDLTNAGVLVKLGRDKMIKNEKGRLVHQWKLK